MALSNRMCSDKIESIIFKPLTGGRDFRLKDNFPRKFINIWQRGTIDTKSYILLGYAEDLDIIQRLKLEQVLFLKLIQSQNMDRQMQE